MLTCRSCSSAQRHWFRRVPQKSCRPLYPTSFAHLVSLSLSFSLSRDLTFSFILYSHFVLPFYFTIAPAENVMAVSPPDSYHPTPDTPLNEDSLRDSMEDLDPQATRKRPRLDSGSRVSESLSVDGMSRSASAPASEMDEDPARPASKVTINMKSPPSPAALELPTTESELPNNAPELQADSDAASANVISIHSSSSQGSPQIEVADLEDMNQESNHTNWKPIAEAINEQGDMEVEAPDIEPLADSFPKLHEDMRPRDNLKAIGDMIEHGE